MNHKITIVTSTGNLGRKYAFSAHCTCGWVGYPVSTPKRAAQDGDDHVLATLPEEI